jgi:diacylglycerol kinase family enzyme
VRVVLVHNPSAGRQAPVDLLRDAIARAGHEVVRVVEGDASLGDLDAIAEVVAVAGGDGSIARVAFELADRGSRIAIAPLPFGTANNIARSLGIGGDDIGALVDGWAAARRITTDLGIARGDWGERRFVEGLGGGLVPAAIAAMVRSKSSEALSPPAKLARAIRTFRETLSAIEPTRITLSVDGDEQTHDVILLEVMIMRSVGPNLILAPDAVFDDGVFDVVLAGVEHRDAIDRYLRCAHNPADDEPLDLPTLRGRRVAMTGWRDLHVDDEIHDDQSCGVVSIEIEPRSVTFLG